MPNESDALALRAWLMTHRGIGYKTASWIARNRVADAPVAVLDVHVIRAGTRIGLFSPSDAVPRDYLKMERQFVDFAAALEARTAELDVLIWAQMRYAVSCGLISSQPSRRAA